MKKQLKNTQNPKPSSKPQKTSQKVEWEAETVEFEEITETKNANHEK